MTVRLHSTRSGLISRIALGLCLLMLSTCSPGPTSTPVLQGIHKIQHIVIVMQENRSFDSYFGTYPGADGIPRDAAGNFTVCMPDPQAQSCVKPYHDSRNLNFDAPHAAAAAVTDINGGKMDGFIAEAESIRENCAGPFDPNCTGGARTDVMGYHDAREVPNYWRYASDFVLQDRMFEPNASWSLPEHLFMVSEWSALCPTHDPSSCRNALDAPVEDRGSGAPSNLFYPWTDLTYLLYRHRISWKYYVEDGTQPDCADGDQPCQPSAQTAATPEIWNPLPYFDTVRQDNQLGNIQGLESFYADVQNNDLPAVSWIVPTGATSEHPPALISSGQAHVTKVIDRIMQSPAWPSTAIFVSWDDWGGFYDHVVPPRVDENGYGLRVPGLVVSPFARRSYIDHQTLSFDAYVKFIEDDFLGGQRLDPAADGRPDPRPTVREQVPILGDLSSDFNFNQSPLGRDVLPLFPGPGPASIG
jgi:phospholipase C